MKLFLLMLLIVATSAVLIAFGGKGSGTKKSGPSEPLSGSNSECY